MSETKQFYYTELSESATTLLDSYNYSKEILAVWTGRNMVNRIPDDSTVMMGNITGADIHSHIGNITVLVNKFEANETEKTTLVEYFKTNVVTHNAVVDALENLRG